MPEVPSRVHTSERPAIRDRLNAHALPVETLHQPPPKWPREHALVLALHSPCSVMDDLGRVRCTIAAEETWDESKLTITSVDT